MASGYSESEIGALTEGYLDLNRERLWILVRLADISKALDTLSQEEKACVLLTIMADFSTREAGEILGLSPSTVARKSRDGLRRINEQVNGTG